MESEKLAMYVLAIHDEEATALIPACLGTGRRDGRQSLKLCICLPVLGVDLVGSREL